MVDYLKMLVEEIHSTTVATIGADGHPQTRIIDMMYYDEEGVYFLTAKGKEFYAHLMEQKYVAISGTKDKMAISLRGKVKNIGKKNLDIMFERNPYMKEIYPGDTREALEVFALYEAQGEYFDISEPSHVVREDILIPCGLNLGVSAKLRDAQKNVRSDEDILIPDRISLGVSAKLRDAQKNGFFTGEECIGCKLCYSVCPQKCIDISVKPVEIDQRHCLRCGNCAQICPKQCIKKRC